LQEKGSEKGNFSTRLFPAIMTLSERDSDAEESGVRQGGGRKEGEEIGGQTTGRTQGKKGGQAAKEEQGGCTHKHTQLSYFM